jgi:hypothetical protein
VFECNACGGKIYLLLKEKAIEAVRCGCTSIMWNLNEKLAGAVKAGGSAGGG